MRQLHSRTNTQLLRRVGHSLETETIPVKGRSIPSLSRRPASPRPTARFDLLLYRLHTSTREEVAIVEESVNR